MKLLCAAYKIPRRGILISTVWNSLKIVVLKSHYIISAMEDWRFLEFSLNYFQILFDHERLVLSSYYTLYLEVTIFELTRSVIATGFITRLINVRHGENYTAGCLFISGMSICKKFRHTKIDFFFFYTYFNTRDFWLKEFFGGKLLQLVGLM